MMRAQMKKGTEKMGLKYNGDWTMRRKLDLRE
jgi:hypothetical protein